MAAGKSERLRKPKEESGSRVTLKNVAKRGRKMKLGILHWLWKEWVS